ncbi:MAG: exonuclease SbcCD subunit D C-terminal domain-containing protein [Acidobacteriota bacterium]
MRFLHLSDWRLGRVWHGVELASEQVRLLEQVVQAARARPVGAVLACGGLHEGTAPSASEREAADEVLASLALEAGVTTIVLAGEAGRPQPSGPGTSILRRQGLHLIDAGHDPTEPIVLGSGADTVDVHAVPGHLGPDELGALHEQLRERPRSRPRVLLARACWSNSEAVVEPARDDDPDPLLGRPWLDVVDQLALKADRPVIAESGRVSEAAPLLPRRFDDLQGGLGLHACELSDAGASVTRETLFLDRTFRRLEGELSEVLAAGPSEDHVALTVSDSRPLPRLGERLATRFPRVMAIERSAPTAHAAGRAGAMEDLLTAYLEHALGEDVAEDDWREVLAEAARAAVSDEPPEEEPRLKADRSAEAAS